MNKRVPQHLVLRLKLQVKIGEDVLLVKTAAQHGNARFTHADHAEQGERMDVVRMAEDLLVKSSFLLTKVT